MSSIPRRFSAISLCVSAVAAMLLSGCSANFQPSAVKDNVEAPQTPIGEITGSVHGGQAPVTGAQIYLFAAGTGGYGTASTSLILSGKPGVTCNTNGTLRGDCFVKTDGNGNFLVSNDYTCTVWNAGVHGGGRRKPRTDRDGKQHGDCADGWIRRMPGVGNDGAACAFSGH